MEKEFLQYIKEMEYHDLLGISEKNILKYKNTLHYKKWLLEKAWEDFIKVMMETKLGKAMVSIAEFLDK